MEFLKQYVRIINYALMGLAFGFGCFYILLNCYHYLEIRKDYSVDFSNQLIIKDISNKMNTVNQNISNFNTNKYKGNIPNNKMMAIYQNLKSCINSFNNETYTGVLNKDKVSIIDVYELRESYENDILNTCIVNNLYWTTSLDSNSFNSSYLVNNKDMMKLYVDTLLNETSYLKKDLLNNSSYFFNTSVASSSIKDNTEDGFYEVMSSYNKAAGFVQFVSDWFRNEVEGNYD